MLTVCTRAGAVLVRVTRWPQDHRRHPHPGNSKTFSLALRIPVQVTLTGRRPGSDARGEVPHHVMSHETRVAGVCRDRIRPRRRGWKGSLVSSVAIAAVTVSLPYLPVIAHRLALRPLPANVLASLVVITLGWLLSAKAAKRSFHGVTQHRRLVRREPAYPRRLVDAIREHGGGRRVPR